MIIITSGALIAPEFQVELGKLPPAFVPLGNKRLYEHQVRCLRTVFSSSNIYLSVPDFYELRESDAVLLAKLGVTVVPVPAGLTLSESLLYVINSIGRYDETLRILHGDTLIEDIPPTEDVVAIAEAEDDYAWEIQSQDKSTERVWCGYFAFSDIKLLARSLSAAQGRFVDAIRAYGRARELEFPLIAKWIDLGHVNTYFRARTKITTQRSFNDLKIKGGVVRKTSEQSGKIEGEAAWFSSIPPSLRRYVPQLIQIRNDCSPSFYELEYLPFLPLSELYVHGNLPHLFWGKIFKLTNSAVNDFLSVAVPDGPVCAQIREDFIKLVIGKTDARLAKFKSESGCDPKKSTRLNGAPLPSLARIAEECAVAVSGLPDKPGVLHGDFCFSNILYDSRSNAIKLLDPRGIGHEGVPTIYGDLKYDAAKILHSVVGLYDHIIAGLCSIKENSVLNFEFQIHLDKSAAAISDDYYNNSFLLGLRAREVLPLTILLFISMLPLHADNTERQKALLANALRLYGKWKD